MAQAPYFPFSLPASSVLGRFSSGAGAPEAIPFGTLATSLALNATSSTSLTVGTGVKTLITQANLPLGIGQLIVVANSATPANFMFGQVTAYAALTGSLTLNVSAIGGSGTFSAWTITTSGPQGTTGAAGSAGSVLPWAVAGGAADVITATYVPANGSLTDGLRLSFRASAANATTTPTFAPDGLTAHTITRSGGTPLVAGDIAGALAENIVVYNLANTRWELQNNIGTRAKLIIATRDYTAASGNVSYTGAGFKPKAAIITAAQNGARIASLCGFCTVGLNFCLYDVQSVADGYGTGLAQCIVLDETTGAKTQTAALSTFDADGITLAWTRTGATDAATIDLGILLLG